MSDYKQQIIHLSPAGRLISGLGTIVKRAQQNGVKVCIFMTSTSLNVPTQKCSPLPS